MSGSDRKRQETAAARGGAPTVAPDAGYEDLLGYVTGLLADARRTSARAVNAVMTATYWAIGRRIVQFEQGGRARAEYGAAVIERLANDLSFRFGRGFSRQNLWQMRAFHLAWPAAWVGRGLPGAAAGAAEILQTPSGVSAGRATVLTASGESAGVAELARAFPLPWSAYVRLLAVANDPARRFYETEALRGGWSVRQLDRQIQAQFFERTVHSRDKATMLRRGAQSQPEDAVTPEQEIKDPYVLEFLDLKDEYSESDLEDALIRRLEVFLLELGSDFCFMGRQKRLRIGDEWYRVDLLLYHRRLRCLVLIDLKLGRFTHADAGQMHVYLNYAAEHWRHPDENPPVGLILCAQKDRALARYALDNLPNKVLAAEYRTVLPDEQLLAGELVETRRLLDNRSWATGQGEPQERRGGEE